MLREIRESLEIRASVLASLIIRVSAIYWLVVLVGKTYFTRQPLLYWYSSSHFTQETVPLGAAALVQVIAFAYQLLKRLALGTAADSLLLHCSSPKIAMASTIVMLVWADAKPAPAASYLPLTLLTLVSIAGSVVVRWGWLSRDAERLRVAVPAGHAGEVAEAVTRVTKPRRSFRDIHGHEQLKDRLLEVARTVIEPGHAGGARPARNGILLHGEPGNGKTVFAEAVAGELGLPLLALSYADVSSKWVGEKTSRVRAGFQEAIRNQPCVLFVDEVDSFLESREAGGAGTVKEDRDLVNAMLTLVVEIRTHKVLLLAATNYLDRLDPAAVREGRFDFKIEVPPPDCSARTGILREALRLHLPQATVSADVIDSVARRWNGYSTKRILAVVEELPSVLHGRGSQAPEFQDFMDALRAVQGHAGPRMGSVRPMNELVLSDRTRGGLQNVIVRLRDPERTERYGGSLPTGMIFYGPPGTGKTAAAKAFGNELGWTFLPVSGAELSSDLSSLSRIYAKAQELRPAIVFIDEADELLRNRDYSMSTEATNKLLTLTDGAGERVRDVVWIAATNHVEQVDPAMLRGGRFGEKIAFELPAKSAVVAHIAGWLGTKDVVLEAGFEVAAVVDLLGQISIADAEAVMQAA